MGAQPATNPNQGGVAQPKPRNLSAPVPPPAGTPPPANVPRKVQVGRPTKVAKTRAPPATQPTGPKQTTPPKPPAAKPKAKGAPAAPGVVAADVEDNQATPTDTEYDTDGLAELPTNSESEAAEFGGDVGDATKEGQ